MDDLELANERIEEILQHEKPLRRKGGYVYSIAARNFFNKIKVLRNRGFSFIQICGAFEKTGLLTEESNPYSFRQAFLRESAKRDRINELLRELKDDPAVEKPAPAREQIQSGDNSASGVNKKDSSTPLLINQEKKRQETKIARSCEETEEERIKKMMSVTVNTGTGIIVKHPDGSFDYQ